MKNASGEGEQECWFEKGGCIESSKMESGSWRDCCKSGVNLATPVYRDKPGSKLELKNCYLFEQTDNEHCNGLPARAPVC